MTNEEATHILIKEKVDCIYFENRDDYIEALELAIKALEEISTSKWIPVSERLPEGKIDPLTNDFEMVMCSTVWGIVRPYKFGKPIGHAKAHFWYGGGVVDDYVTAWMPFPEGYKEEENEDNPE